MPRQSIAELVARFEELGSGPAFVFRRGLRTHRWSYSELADWARRFAAELSARGIRPGEHVMLWAPNCAEWAAAFFGCVLAGVVVVPMDEAAAPDFALRVAGEVSARLVVCSRRQSARLGKIPAIAIEDLAEAVAARPLLLTAHPTTRADTLEIIFTSGTTSTPRGVVLTHGNVLANLEPLEAQIAKYLRYERIFHPLKLLDLLPLSHVFGQFLGLFVPQFFGACVVFHDTLNPGEVIRLIHAERVSACICVPRMLQSLRQKLEADLAAADALERLRRDFTRSEGEHFLRRMWRFRRIHRIFGWRFWAFISGGAALDEATERFWQRMSLAVVQGYGLTETTSLISVNNPFHIGSRSIGRILPGSEARLAPDGEILVRGANIAAAYWQDGGMQPVAGEEAWFHTGDLGAFDEKGNLYFKGRKKKLIVTAAGMNIHPEDLEAAIKRQPGVRDCVVVGVSAAGDTEPCAVVLLAPEEGNAEVCAEGVIRVANRELADYQQIRQWRVWPESDFPRTPTQKPRLPEIEAFARESTHAAGSASRASVLASLIARIQGGAEASEAASTATLEALNLSSLDRVELLAAIEDRYQVDLSDQAFTSAGTLAALEAEVRQSQSAQAATAAYSYPRWPLHPIMRFLRNVVFHAVTRNYITLMAHPRVIYSNGQSAEQLRRLRGPVLVVSNHVTYIDIGFVLHALPWRLRTHLATAMQGDLLMEMRHPPSERNLIRRLLDRLDYYLVMGLFNVFPLPQSAAFRQSFEFAGRAADLGYSVLIFPEGRRTADGQLKPFQAGAGILANRLDVPVLPVRIDGLYEAARAHKHFVRPGTITVHIGELVTYPPGENPHTITRDLERRVREA